MTTAKENVLLDRRGMLRTAMTQTTNMDNASSFLPIIPPKAPRETLSYCRAIASAPYTALSGVLVYGSQPDMHPTNPRCRIRQQVGSTNRWRIPGSLGSDLLGSSQALKAIFESYSPSMLSMMTADNARMSLNSELSDQETAAIPSLPIGRPASCDSTQSYRSAKVSTRISTFRPLDSPLPIRKFTPPSVQTPTPQNIFNYHTDDINNSNPDVLLHCLGMDWELHRHYLQKSAKLADLLKKAQSLAQSSETRTRKTRPIKSSGDDTVDNVETICVHGLSDRRRRWEHFTHSSPASRIAAMTKIELKITSSLVTKQALAIALGNLYKQTPAVHNDEVVGVFAVAKTLRFDSLVKRCEEIMLATVSPFTVSDYYQAARKFDRHHLISCCEKWLELNLVQGLGLQIQLRDLPFDVLQKILKSSRLYTPNEYALYKVVCYWLFLQLSPRIQLLPSLSSVITYFNSLPKNCSFLEREEGYNYMPLFSALRLQGVTEPIHLETIEKMNIIPRTWVLKLMNLHYRALQGGGDMSLMMDFSSSALRYGFIIQQPPQYQSEILSIHGFHFELKAHCLDDVDGNFCFYMQRLKPNDPILSLGAVERQTFSMRQDREVVYSIRIQWVADGEFHGFTTGEKRQRFTFTGAACKSEVLTLDNLVTPIFVTFSILFPPS